MLLILARSVFSFMKWAMFTALKPNQIQSISITRKCKNTSPCVMVFVHNAAHNPYIIRIMLSSLFITLLHTQFTFLFVYLFVKSSDQYRVISFFFVSPVSLFLFSFTKQRLARTHTQRNATQHNTMPSESIRMSILMLFQIYAN